MKKIFQFTPNFPIFNLTRFDIIMIFSGVIGFRPTGGERNAVRPYRYNTL